MFRFVLGKLWPKNRDRPLDNNSAVELRMTFRCMPAFQTLGGGADCGASWVSALRLCKTHAIAAIARKCGGRAWWPFFCGFMKYLAATLLFDILVALGPFWCLRISSPVPLCARIVRHVKRWTPTNARDTKDLYRQYLRTYSYFYSINSLSSFSKRSYRGLALRNFIEKFSLKCVAIFLHIGR